MTPRRYLAGTTLALLVLAGCSSTPAAGPTPTVSTRSATATAVPDTGAQTLARVQEDLASREGIRVRTSTAAKPGSGSSLVTANLRTGVFRAELDLGPGNGSLQMLRIADTTWTRAPEKVWIGLGYTPASARRAQGKWVVARADAIKQLVDGLDPVAMVQQLVRTNTADVLSARVVASGPQQGFSVLRVRSNLGVRTLLVSAGPHPRLVQIRAGTGSAHVTYDVVGYPDDVDVEVPAAAAVLQQR